LQPSGKKEILQARRRHKPEFHEGFVELRPQSVDPRVLATGQPASTGKTNKFIQLIEVLGPFNRSKKEMFSQNEREEKHEHKYEQESRQSVHKFQKIFLITKNSNIDLYSQIQGCKAYKG